MSKYPTYTCPHCGANTARRAYGAGDRMYHCFGCGTVYQEEAQTAILDLPQLQCNPDVQRVNQFALTYENILATLKLLDQQAAEIETLKANCDSETAWASHYLKKSQEADVDAFEQRARADHAEEVLGLLVQAAGIAWTGQESEVEQALGQIQKLTQALDQALAEITSLTADVESYRDTLVDNETYCLQVVRERAAAIQRIERLQTENAALKVALEEFREASHDA